VNVARQRIKTALTDSTTARRIRLPRSTISADVMLPKSISASATDQSVAAGNGGTRQLDDASTRPVLLNEDPH
jgi:hypothetical protein